MDIRKLQRAIVDGLEDVKAQNIAVFNTEHLSPLFERVIVASGTSNRQTKALASSVRETVKSRGMDVLRMEGEENGEWIIVDCGAAVCHVMQPAIREYYRLEEIWGGKAVKMKMGGPATRGLVKASSDDEADEEAEAPAPASSGRRTAARKAASGGASAKKTPARKSPAGKATAETAPGKTSRAPRRTTSASGEAAPAPASAPRRAAAKKTPARPSSTRDTAAAAASRKAAAGTPARGRRTTAGSAEPVRTVVVPSAPRKAKASPKPTPASPARKAPARKATPASPAAGRKSARGGSR